MTSTEEGEFYGRRFLYRTTTGSVLVVTVPLKAGVSPYTGPGCEDFASYPTLRPRGRVAAGCRALRPKGDVPGEFEADADPPDQGTARLQAVTIEPASSGRTQLSLRDPVGSVESGRLPRRGGSLSSSTESPVRRFHCALDRPKGG